MMKKTWLCVWLFLLIQGSAMSAIQSKMPMRYVPRFQQSISFLGLGTVELGRDWGIEDPEHPQEMQAKTILETAMQVGMTVVDTASSYQLSEERIGRYLPKQKYNYLLISKPGETNLKADDVRCKKQSYDGIYCQSPGGIYDFSEAAIRKDIENSLFKMKVRQLDVALLHLQNETALQVLKKGEAIKTLIALKKEGKIKYIGVSVNGEGALYAAQYEPIDAIELEYNLLNQTNHEAIEKAAGRGIAVFVRGGLGTGLLTKDVAKHLQDPLLPFGKQVRALLKLTHHDYDQLTALALYFLYHNPHISGVVIGADKSHYLMKDIALLTHFKDEVLLTRAIKLLKTFPAPQQFTEIMGEYYL